jgi:hypothetical protein
MTLIFLHLWCGFRLNEQRRHGVKGNLMVMLAQASNWVKLVI